MPRDESDVKPVSISEVKNMLQKASKDREELIYEQKIALEHAQKFATLSVKKTKELVNELMKIEFIKEKYAYKIADILPATDDDLKTIFAKERVTISDDDSKKILDLVAKYSD